MTQGDEDAVPLVLELRAYVRCVEEKQLDGLKGVAALMAQAADAIEALSIPQGLGEKEVERAARKAFITFAVEQGCATTLSGLSISKTAFDAGFRAALTSARAQ